MADLEKLQALLRARKVARDYSGYVPPEDGQAAEYWAEGYNDALDEFGATALKLLAVAEQARAALAEYDRIWRVQPKTVAALRTAISELGGEDGR
jgi:hypothetical protein